MLGLVGIQGFGEGSIDNHEDPQSIWRHRTRSFPPHHNLALSRLTETVHACSSRTSAIGIAYRYLGGVRASYCWGAGTNHTLAPEVFHG
jgi:hypothetical protein